MMEDVINAYDSDRESAEMTGQTDTLPLRHSINTTNPSLPLCHLTPIFLCRPLT
jgi:hypothetical protein